MGLAAPRMSNGAREMSPARRLIRSEMSAATMPMKGDGHRKAIPEESRVGGMPVVVAGTECGEEEPEENEEVGMTFATIKKCCG